MFKHPPEVDKPHRKCRQCQTLRQVNSIASMLLVGNHKFGHYLAARKYINKPKPGPVVSGLEGKTTPPAYAGPSAITAGGSDPARGTKRSQERIAQQ